MKRLIAMLLAIVMVFALAACGGAASQPAQPAEDPAQSANTEAAPETITIKFAHGFPSAELICTMLDKWMALVTERTDGVVQWDYYPGGSLGSITELMEQADLGAIDCTLTDTSQLQNLCDMYGILYYPFLIQSYDHQMKVLNDDAIMAKFNEALAEQTNLYAVGYCVNGQRNICTTKLITNLDDCKNVVLRVPEIQVYKDTASLLGMTPTAISYNDAYTAVSTGVCDGLEVPNTSMYPGGFHQVAPYILKSGHMFASCAVEFNQDVWDSYPVEIRQIMTDTYKEVSEEYTAQIEAADEEYYKLYLEEGCTVSDWDDPSAPAAACEDYWLTSAEKLSPDAVEVVKAIVALRS